MFKNILKLKLLFFKQTYEYADHVFKDILKYSCDIGFYLMSENNQLNCDSSGHWSNSKHLKCLPVNCPIENIENSEYT